MRIRYKHIRKTVPRFTGLVNSWDWQSNNYQSLEELAQISIAFRKMLRNQKDLTKEKLDNFYDRLLSLTFRKYPKPLCVIYLSHTILNEIKENGSRFLESINKHIDGRYFVLVLPVNDTEDARAELWFRGRKTKNISMRLYEGNIQAFHAMFQMSNF